MNSELEMLSQFRGTQCGTCNLSGSQEGGVSAVEGLVAECEFGQTELAFGEGALQQGLGGEINKGMSIQKIRYTPTQKGEMY